MTIATRPESATTAASTGLAARRRTSQRLPDAGNARTWWIMALMVLAFSFCMVMQFRQSPYELSSKPIDTIRLGDNVPGVNPAEADDLTFGDSIDPDTWKMVRLTAQQGDGTLVEISLLRPDSWLAERSAVVGSVIDGLEFGRLGVVGDATVETIAACPPIRPGPGRTVTGIYKHFGQQVLDLRTANGEEIGVTPDHRFWSADRREFVQAGDLRPGESLNLLDGTTTVTSITPRPSGEPVSTLEVHVEHVYHVAKSGVLVHNCDVVPGKEVAFGFSQNLGRFKKQFPNAKNYDDLGLNPYADDFAQHLRSAMDDADVIRFDASGMRMLTGPQGVLTGPKHLNSLGSTNWELRTIYDDPTLRAKTLIYVDGTRKTFDYLLRMQ